MDRKVKTFFRSMKLVPSILISFSSILSFPPFPENEIYEKIKLWEKRKGIASAGIYSIEEKNFPVVYRKELFFNRKLPAGSVMKPITARIFILEKEGFQLDTHPKIFCDGKYHVHQEDMTLGDLNQFNILSENNGDYYFRCSISAGHGEINLEDAISKSCNAFFLEVSGRNSGLLLEKLNEFKLKSGIKTDNLTPPKGLSRLMLSIGEGDGFLITPSEISLLYSNLPHSGEEWNSLTRGMKKTAEEGTLSGIQNNYKEIKIIAAKTGTATKIGTKYKTHGWNIFILKYFNKKYILTIFVETGNGKHTARSLSEAILNELEKIAGIFKSGKIPPGH